MNFGIDTVIKSVSKAFNLKKNIITIIHLVIGFAIFFGLIYLGVLTNNPLIIFLFGFIGYLLLYYILIRAYYLLTFFALGELNSDGKPDYGAATQAFDKQRWTAVFAPLVLILFFIVVILIEALLLYILALIPVVGAVINAIIFLALFIVNFGLLLVIFFGSGLMFAIMIDQQTGVISTIKAVIIAVRKRFQSLLVYNVLASLIVGSLVFLLFFIGFFALLPAGGAFFSSFTNFGSMSYGAWGANQWFFTDNVNIVALIIMLINLVVVFSFLYSFLINIVIGVQCSIYAAIKEGLNFKEGLKFDLGGLKDKVKE